MPARRVGCDVARTADTPLSWIGHVHRVVELHVAGVEADRDLGGPWIGTAVPSPELLDLARFATERAPALRAVTFDAFSSAMTAATLRDGVQAIRDGLGLPA